MQGDYYTQVVPPQQQQPLIGFTYSNYFPYGYSTAMAAPVASTNISSIGQTISIPKSSEKQKKTKQKNANNNTRKFEETNSTDESIHLVKSRKSGESAPTRIECDHINKKRSQSGNSLSHVDCEEHQCETSLQRQLSRSQERCVSTNSGAEIECSSDHNNHLSFEIASGKTKSKKRKEKKNRKCTYHYSDVENLSYNETRLVEHGYLQNQPYTQYTPSPNYPFSPQEFTYDTNTPPQFQTQYQVQNEHYSYPCGYQGYEAAAPGGPMPLPVTVTVPLPVQVDYSQYQQQSVQPAQYQENVQYNPGYVAQVGQPQSSYYSSDQCYSQQPPSSSVPAQGVDNLYPQTQSFGPVIDQQQSTQYIPGLPPGAKIVAEYFLGYLDDPQFQAQAQEYQTQQQQQQYQVSQQQQQQIQQYTQQTYQAQAYQVPAQGYQLAAQQYNTQSYPTQSQQYTTTYPQYTPTQPQCLKEEVDIEVWESKKRDVDPLSGYVCETACDDRKVIECDRKQSEYCFEKKIACENKNIPECPRNHSECITRGNDCLRTNDFSKINECSRANECNVGNGTGNGERDLKQLKDDIIRTIQNELGNLKLDSKSEPIQPIFLMPKQCDQSQQKPVYIPRNIYVPVIRPVFVPRERIIVRPQIIHVARPVLVDRPVPIQQRPIVIERDRPVPIRVETIERTEPCGSGGGSGNNENCTERNIESGQEVTYHEFTQTYPPVSATNEFTTSKNFSYNEQNEEYDEERRKQEVINILEEAERRKQVLLSKSSENLVTHTYNNNYGNSDTVKVLDSMLGNNQGYTLEVLDQRVSDKFEKTDTETIKARYGVDSFNYLPTTEMISNTSRNSNYSSSNSNTNNNNNKNSNHNLSNTNNNNPNEYYGSSGGNTVQNLGKSGSFKSLTSGNEIRASNSSSNIFTNYGVGDAPTPFGTVTNVTQIPSPGSRGAMSSQAQTPVVIQNVQKLIQSYGGYTSENTPNTSINE